MAFGIYNIALASITVALVAVWLLQPGWGTLELFALFILALPVYLPLLYRFCVRLWVMRQRRRLGLPPISDRDLIDFVGEELDRFGVDWHWRLNWRAAAFGDEIEIGGDEDDDLAIRARNGLLQVTTPVHGTTRFVDPIEAIDHALSLYDGPVRADSAVYVETADERS